MKNLIVSVLALCAGVLIFSSPAAAGGIPVEDEEPVEEEVLVESDAVSAPAPAAEPEKTPFPVRIGGAMRVNYAYGDYDNSRRGEDLGDVDLDTFRINVDLSHENLIGKAEYRFYDGYSMMHTAWLGYRSDGLGTLKAGIVRVPFGPGPYGASVSWFFDQHYYVGLSDDMDLGVMWTKALGDLTVDLAYYIQDEGNWDGKSLDSARYSYDVVRRDGDGAGFEETHQFNLRLVYSTDGIGDLGASFQYGMLKGKNVDDDGAGHYAVSGHARTPIGDFTLFSQITYYEYDITDDTPWGTGELIPMGAYDYAALVASRAVVPALSLSYGGIDTSGISWLDGVTPYVEWSSIIKRAEGHNDSSMFTVGAAWARGGWYIYTDLAFSDGNYFVGDTGDFGANADNEWQKRFNINFGYYF